MAFMDFLLRSELNEMVDPFNPSSYNCILEMVQDFATAEEEQRTIARNIGGVPERFMGDNGKHITNLWIFI